MELPQELIELQDLVTPLVLETPDVTGTAIGAVPSEDGLDPDLAVIVYVRPGSALSLATLLPGFDGQPLQLLEAEFSISDDRTLGIDGGAMINECGLGSGTLCALVNMSQGLGGLTCGHVLCKEAENGSDAACAARAVAQPAASALSCRERQVGTVVKAVWGDVQRSDGTTVTLDAAVFALTPAGKARKPRASVRDIPGTVRGVGSMSLRDTVRLRGAETAQVKTALVHAARTRFSLIVEKSTGRAKPYLDCAVLMSQDANLSMEGDSGAPVVDADGRLVAMLCGSTVANSTPSLAVVTRIEDLTSLMGISVAVLPKVTGVSPPSGPANEVTSDITITGEGFVEPVEVAFGDLAAEDVTVQDEETLLVSAPAQDLGAVDVIVTSEAGDSDVDEAATFTYEETA